MLILEWNTLIVGAVSKVAFGKSLEEDQRIEAEIIYAFHLGLPALIFDCPEKSDDISRLARLLQGKMSSFSNYHTFDYLDYRIFFTSFFQNLYFS